MIISGNQLLWNIQRKENDKTLKAQLSNQKCFKFQVFSQVKSQDIEELKEKDSCYFV
jgi:hypothetical protein